MREYGDRVYLYRNILRRYPQYLAGADAAAELVAAEETAGGESGYKEDCSADKSSGDTLYLYTFAPAITAFLTWVLTRAKRDGVSRLYFLARDMWQCYDAAKVLCEKIEDAPELRYLYVSRQSLDEKTSPLIRDYLKQEGLYDEASYAIVDTGWLGTTQQRMTALCKKPVRGYYFGLYGIPKGQKREYYHTWYFGPRNGIRRKIHFANSLLEAVLSAPDGTTEGYCRAEDGRICPLLRTQGNPNGLAMERYRGLLLSYVTSGFVDADYKENSLAMTEALLSHLMGVPTVGEVEAFGDLLFCENGKDESFEAVAVPWTDAEYQSQRLFRKVYLKATGHKLHESAWPQASFIRNPRYKTRDLYGERFYRWVMYVRMWLRG